LFLDLSPEMRQAQKIRQGGLWISCIGWVQLLAAGLLYVAAVQANGFAALPRVVPRPDGRGGIISDVFDPSFEDIRDREQSASFSLFAIGGTMAVGGFIAFTIGQARMSVWHKAHPKDPLPSLSGLSGY
jgi:hypothetical protein